MFRAYASAALVVALTIIQVFPVIADDAQPPRVRPDDDLVALTFDDGPHPYWTPLILDALDRHGVRATFFVVGANVAAYPEIVADMARRGHSVQNHTWDHPWLTHLSDEAIGWQLDRTDEVIWDITGVVPECMRPPFMDVSGRVRRISAGRAKEVVLWDRDPQEWRFRSVPAMVDLLTLWTRGGDVILVHDHAGAVVLPALDQVIPELRAQGLDFDVICAPSAAGPFEPRRFVGANELN